MARKRKNTSKSTDKVEVTHDDALTSDADLAAIEALLDGDAEVQLDSPEPDPAPEEAAAASESDDDHELVDEALAAIESDEDVDDEVAAEIEGEEAKAAAYAEQESDVEMVEDKKEKKPRAPTLSFEETIRLMHANEPLVLDVEEGPLDDAGVNTLIADVPQKKVKEKVTNLLNGVLNDGNISKYTVIALEVLKAAYHEECKPVTAGDIKKAYEAHGYKSGTVNAQQGQMMVLFSALGMAKRVDRSTLQPNPNSVLLDALCA